MVPCLAEQTKFFTLMLSIDQHLAADGQYEFHHCMPDSMLLDREAAHLQRSHQKDELRGDQCPGFSSTAAGHSEIVPGSSREQYAGLVRTTDDQRGGGSEAARIRKPVDGSRGTGAGTAFVGQRSTRCGPARSTSGSENRERCLRQFNNRMRADDRIEREEVLEMSALLRSSAYARAYRSPSLSGRERRTPFRLSLES